MYDVGILGGMGSKATSLMFNVIVDNTDAKSDQEHLRIVVLNASNIPDRTGYLLGKSKLNPLGPMMNEISNFNYLKPKNIVIPCNTSHYFYNELANHSEAPIINMIEVTLDYIHLLNSNYKVCILGTTGTINLKIYEKFNKHNIPIIYPNENLTDQIHQIIYSMKENGENADALSDKLKQIMTQTEADYNQKLIFVLACTELSLLNKKYFENFITVDALEISALSAILKAGKKIIVNRLNYDYSLLNLI